MQPARSRPSARPNKSGAKIRILLVFLGLPRARIYLRTRPGTPPRRRSSRSFWERADLLEILWEARNCWRRRIQEAHPDRHGGSHALAAQLNAAWRTVQILFRNHGFTLD
jgi:hypothetical protein